MKKAVLFFLLVPALFVLAGCPSEPGNTPPQTTAWDRLPVPEFKTAAKVTLHGLGYDTPTMPRQGGAINRECKSRKSPGNHKRAGGFQLRSKFSDPGF
jgi:hypothetical protein